MAQGLVSPIRDVVHDYIAPTIFEREIIDSVYYQRLHFVLQNSTVYSTYPCNKNSRFVHSLGASHLAGRMFIQALKNSPPDVFTEFLSAADSLLGKLGNIDRADNYTKPWEKLIGNASRFLHNPVGGKEPVRTERLPNVTFPIEFIVNTYWIAVRICGLTHDIGHMPSSHLFEHALETAPELIGRYLEEPESAEDAREIMEGFNKRSISDLFSPERDDKSRQKILAIYADAIYGGETSALEDYIELEMAAHEVRGYQILDHISKTSDDHDRSDQSYRDLVLQLSMCIFLACSKDALIGDKKLPGFLYSIRQIIAGEIDADRLDYTARDALASGIELGALDIERIVNAQILVRDDRGGEGSNALTICPMVSAVSAVGAFFHQRYLSYENIIYHKSVQRADLVLEEIITHLIYICVIDPNGSIAEICEQQHLAKFEGEGKQKKAVSILPFAQFFRMDDGWLKSLISQCMILLQDKKDGELSVSESFLLDFMTSYFARDTSYCHVLFKSRLDCRQYCKDEELGEDIFLIEKNQSKVKLHFLKHNKSSISTDSVVLYRYLKPKLYDSVEEDAQAGGAVVYDHKRGRLVSLSDASPYIHSLVSVANKSPNLFMMRFGKNVHPRIYPEKAVEWKNQFLKKLALSLSVTE